MYKSVRNSHFIFVIQAKNIHITGICLFNPSQAALDKYAKKKERCRKQNGFFIYANVQEENGSVMKKRNKRTRLKIVDRLRQPVLPRTHGPLYYSLFHAVSTECFEMSETEAGITIMYLASSRQAFIYVKWKKFMRTSNKRDFAVTIISIISINFTRMNSR